MASSSTADRIERRPPPYNDVEATEQDPLIERDDAEEHQKEVDLKWTLWDYGWTALITIVVAVALGLSIRAFLNAKEVNIDWGEVAKKSLGGGLSGAAAMVIQVLVFMPLRTIMNYQYRYGTGLVEATKTLYAEGGIGRYYSGLGAALFQAPLSRFGDTAANQGVISLLNSNPATKDLPLAVKTFYASIVASLFRMILAPVDTLKTTLQAQGQGGLALLRRRIKVNGIGSLWYGAFATGAATLVGHFPWFYTYNYLGEAIPVPNALILQLLRQGLIGFLASIASDSISNSLHVVKTYRQVNETKISYANAARAVIASDGLIGLFGRGLKTRILVNGLQGLVFSILWKLFMDLWDKGTKS